VKRNFLAYPKKIQACFDILKQLDTKESVMPISLNLGTIDIENKEVANFIQNKSIDEIKSMIVDFISHQVKVISNKPAPKKEKWAKVADEMHGTMSHNTVEYLRGLAQ